VPRPDIFIIVRSGRSCIHQNRCLSMRLTLLTAAALCVAAPVAAQQPDPDSIARGATQQILANQGDVQDYSVVLVHGPVRMPAYVRRDGDEWTVQSPPDHPLADLLTITLQWPNMAAEVLEGEEDGSEWDQTARYLGIEEVGGRRAHVVGGGFPEDTEDVPDTMRLYVDVETRQMLRMVMSTQLEEEEDEGGMPLGGDLQITVDLADYATHGGLTLPTRMRLLLKAGLAPSPDELAEARVQVALARTVLQQMEGEEAAQMSAMMDLLESLMLRGEVDLAVQVEEVQVNSGPPAWLEDDGAR
jgi:hypothetical protein